MAYRLFIISGLFHFTHALCPKLIELSTSFDPANRYDHEWLNSAQDVLLEITDDQTFFNTDEDCVFANNVIELKEKTYKDLFLDTEKNEEVWYIVFIRKRRT